MSLKAKQAEKLEEIVDKSLGRQAMEAARKMMGLAFMCIEGIARRPPMKIVVEELERIQEGENARLSSELDIQIGAVTLGSELFKWVLWLSGNLVILLLNFSWV